MAPILPSVSATVNKLGQASAITRGQRCCACCRDAFMMSYVCATRVTRNVKDFASLGVVLLNPWDEV